MEEDLMKDPLDLRRIELSLSVREILTLKGMLLLGKLLTQPADRECVDGVMLRVNRRLKGLGISPEQADELTRL
jgi:hypothetical protein